MRNSSLPIRPRPFWPALRGVLTGQYAPLSWPRRIGQAILLSLRHAAYQRDSPESSWRIEQWNCWQHRAHEDFAVVLAGGPTQPWSLQAARLLKASAVVQPADGYPSYDFRGATLRRVLRKTGPIALFIRGRLFRLEPAHLALPLDGLRQVLDACVARAEAANAHSPSILSREDPRRQHAWFQELAEPADLHAGLQLLSECVLTLCLEPDTHPSTPYDAGAAAYLGAPHNRWHDVGVQLVVFGNGTSAIVMSFRLGFDGNPARQWSSKLADAARSLTPTEDAAAPAPLPLELPWRLPAPSSVWQTRLHDAQQMMRPRAGCLRLGRGIGRRHFTDRGISADAAFQLALAVWACQQELPASPELRQMVDMTRTYRNERVANRTVVIPEFIAVLKALEREDSPAQVREAILRASHAHKSAVHAFRTRPLPRDYARFLLDRTQTHAPSTESQLIMISSNLVPDHNLPCAGRFNIEYPELWLTVHYTIFEKSLALLIALGDRMDQRTCALQIADEILDSWKLVAQLVGDECELPFQIGDLDFSTDF